MIMNKTNKTETTEMLEVRPASDLPQSDEKTAWLVEGLWGQQAVGMLAGHPKSGKSWLGLQMAFSVATGTACLGRFQVKTSGGVLIYLAEDALAQVRKRLECIAAHYVDTLSDLPIWVICAPTLRLDCPSDQKRLEATIQALRPALLLLDPLVRLHRCDENDAGAIAALLSYLRQLQRQYATAVILVHHARKNGGSGGLALRGSSDLWAWGDSNLYLKKARGKLMLQPEQRCAKALEPIELRLNDQDPKAVHLEVVGETNAKNTTLRKRLLSALAEGPMTRTKLRETLGIQNRRLGSLLKQVADDGLVLSTKQGWRVRAPAKSSNAEKNNQDTNRSLFPLWD